MMGHSVGEYVAACLGGVFSLEDALALVAARGRLMQALPAGAMLAVPLSEQELTPLLGADLSLAAVNAPALCVASGPAAAIDGLEAALAARKVTARRLETSHAFHSSMMDPVLDAFAAEVARVERQPPQIPIVSNVTGTWMTAAEAADPVYWTQHLRQAVRFGAGVQALLADSGRVLLEVGPGRTLASLARLQGTSAQGRTILTSLRHPHETHDDLTLALQTLGRLWLSGLTVDWQAFSSGENRRRIPLPTYPFERQRYWIDARRQDAAVSAPGALAKNGDLASWFYTSAWIASDAGRPRTLAGPWLVFAGRDAVGAELVARLKATGDPVAVVQIGERFTRTDADRYALNPGQPEDYRALLDALAREERMPRRVVHMWSLGADVADDLLAGAMDRGFYSLLFLVQALARTAPKTAVDLTIVGDQLRAVDAADIVAPEKTPLLGLCLVIPQEHPHVRCATVDVRPADNDASATADLIAGEIHAERPVAAAAYRGVQRFVHATRQASVAASADAIRQHGVYLITGGLGNIGLAMAERLAREYRARLVLVGRSMPPPRDAWQGWIDSHPAGDRVSRQITALRVLEALGAEVLVARADVSNLDEMRAVVADAVKRFGAIHGVIHAAGSLTGGVEPILSLSRDTCELQFRPKVRGLCALDEATADLALDFCLLTSSLSAVLGGLGYGAYAAANQFLDGFAEQRNASGGRRWISVNLDGWAFESNGITTAVGALEMTPAEGVESLLRVLKDPSLTRAAISTGDLAARLDRYVNGVRTIARDAAQAAATSRYARPDIGTEYAAPVDEIERTIASVWQEALGIANIGRDDNFFDLGGHSMLLVQVHDTLVEKLGRTLPVTDLFQFSTIASLAAHLGGGPRETPAMRVAERPSPSVSNEVAIIGMAGRFPGAANVEAFWTNLRNGVESIESLSDEQLRTAGVADDLLRNPRYVKAASTLENVDLFDAGFFGYSPREAELIDPQHRLFLECAWEALEHAGYDPKQYDGQIGVYAGANSNAYLLHVLSNQDVMQTMGSLQAGIGNRSDHMPTRVSYKLSLRGPSLNVQTACSTSLVAVHEAYRSLVDGECDMALAGGASIAGGIIGKTGYLSQEDGILSPDGHCRAFDAQAQGTIWGDGVGIVLLKRLSDAIADGDTIHAVIRGTAINNDGAAKVGYTAPSVDGQAIVVARALAVAGVSPADVSYVEAHGTGTALGDPIEVAALTQAFGPLPAESCAIGTLKSNVGHLDAAAGVAGLIKTTLALAHRELPPSLHFTTPNPKIDFAGSPFFVNTRLRPWETDTTPRRAGVSAFGIGGTNAHVVLEEAPALPPASASRAWQLITLSARTAAALETVAGRLVEYLEANPDAPLADVAHTLHVGRRTFAHRLFVVASECAVTAKALRDAGHTATSTVESGERAPVFMFSGQGAQYVGMARDLYRDEAGFRADVDACCERLAADLGCDLRTVLYPEDGAEETARERLTDTRLAQPALFVTEYALARMWMRWGIRPAALIGHSIGEYVAACLAGVFSLDDALTLVAARGRLMQALPAGAMLAVPMAEEELLPLLGPDLSLAAVNGPALCVASGPFDAIGALESRLAEKGITARRLETSHAFHSAMMEPALEAFAAVVERTERRAPRIPFISNLTGAWMTAAEAADSQYWTRHLRQAVRFAAGVQELLKEPTRVFVEVGPGRTLASLLRQQTAARGRVILTSLRHPHETQADLPLVLQTLGRLWLAGAQVDWHAFNAGEVRRRIPLPTYPFERKRYWIDARPAAPIASARGPIVKNPDLASWFYAPSWTRAAAARRRAAAGASDSWLLFVDDGPLGSELAVRLRQSGETVVTVRTGAAFATPGHDEYTLGPGSAPDYDTLVSALARSGRLPRHVVHLWSTGRSGALALDNDVLAQAQDRGYYSVLFLIQALAKLDRRDPLALTIVGDRLRAVERGDLVAPEKTAVLALAIVIPQEHPHVRCATIDVESTPANGTGVLADLLAAELHGDSTSTNIAYRGSQRWLQTPQPLTVAPVGATALRERGVYLITGGLGRIGLAIAERLARDVHARLVLVGRTTPPPRGEWDRWIDTHPGGDRIVRQINAVRQIEALGAEVLTVAADVASTEQMRKALERTIERFGALHGVIHAAGELQESLHAVTTLSREICERQFRPKMAGLLALDDATADLELDFRLLTSSVSALLGGLGYGAYAAGNQFLDAFAEQCAALNGRRWVSVNLDGWAFEAGAATTAAGALEMLPVEGVETLVRILSEKSLTRVVVSTGDLQARLDRYVTRTPLTGATASAAAASSTSRYERPAIPTTFAAPVDEIEKTIAAVWQEALGIAEIGRDDNFFDLGGHSLLLIQVQDILGTRLGRPISVTDLFQFPTIATLSAHLGGAKRELPLVKVTASRETTPRAIAIVGMAGRFPGSPDVEAFWANLRAGVESIERLTDDQLRAAGIGDDLLQNPRYVKAVSTINGVDLFDAAFFGYTPREAELIDPQHRVFLECAWEALEQAGYDPKQYTGQIGVYAGTNSSEYVVNVFSNPDIVQTVGTLQAAIANRGDHLPTRVSYKLSLRGPSVNVQTACSTSLVAVHHACRSLVDGECDMALAGGVSIGGGIHGKIGYLSQDEGILSPDGHCRAFDAQAQGTIWADGVGVVVLKRLADAVADGDTIRAVIRGTAINNDGAAKVGYTAPSVDGQAAVVARALAVAGVLPGEVSYVEAHGTGTALGDPIEVAALTQAFGPLAPESCAIGTLKSNVGHLDAAAGVAGLIKTALALEHRELPPSLHFTRPNPKIDFVGSPFFVNARLRAWDGNGAPRRAGVSAFGIGGTNAHAVVEEAPAAEEPAPSRPWQLVQLSSRTAGALEAAAERLAGYLEEHSGASLPDVAHTLRVGRRNFPHRRIVICRTVAEALQALRRVERSASLTGVVESSAGKPCVFLFSGQGSQYVGMARELYRDEPSFRADVDDCCERLLPHLGLDLRTVLYPAEETPADRERLTETRLAQPTLFVIEYALAQLWMRWGVRPAAMIGHSLGEYVAACLAGVFTLDDALTLVAARGRLMQALPAGAMLAVPLSEQDLRPQLGTEISLAAVNGPALCVASGPTAAIEALEDRLTARGVTSRRLHTSHAFHSGMMDPALEAFAVEVARVDRQAPKMPFVSNVTGTWITADEATSVDYWVSHLRQPVRFADGVQTVLADSRVCLEVGPGRTLATLVQQQRQQAERGRPVLPVVTTLRHPDEREADQAVLLRALGQLWLSGVAIDWSGFTAAERRRRVPLPTYPFERKRFWITRKALAIVSPTPKVERAELADWFHLHSWKRSMVPAPAAPAATASRWLLFADGAGLASRVEQLLLSRGHDVTVVEPGSQFAHVSDRRYAIGGASADDYGLLLRALANSGRAPDVIGHFWGYTSEAPEEPRDSSLCLERGFYSLLYLAQALGDLGSSQPVSLAVVTTDMHEVTGDELLSPSRATIVGPCRVIPAEYPHVSCRAIDLVASEWMLAGDRQIAELVAEMTDGAPISAYRRGHRWLETLEPARLGEVPAHGPSRLRERGVYLITGGLGGVGLTLAEYLARSVGARLVLIGRHGLPERSQWAKYLQSHGDDDRLSRQIHVVDALERAGAEVMVVAGDVSSVAEMRATVEAARRRFGSLDGVIHAAGVPGGGVIQLKKPGVAASVLSPKVAGTQALSQAVAGVDLDFFVLCSSTISVFGGGGQVDYCAANAYLDAFAHDYARRTGTHTVAINWDAWQQVGMAVNTAVTGPGQLARDREELLRRGITPDEGIEVFRRVLAYCTTPQILVSTVPIVPVAPHKTDVRSEAGVAEDAGAIPDAQQPSHERPELGAAYVAPTNEVERTMCDVWQQLLGINGVGIHDNFFELGGHSLLAMQLASRLQHAMGIDIRLATFFQAPTIAEMSDFVLQQLLEGEGSEVAEALLSEVTDAGLRRDPP
jgi:acyl transferase domain-containing protein/acyl carrier protein